MKPGKVILITGATSGFGRTASGMLSAAGHTVYGTGRSVQEGTRDDGVRMLRLDVTVPSSIDEAVGKIIAAEGRIDVLVNNAGAGIGGSLELATEEERCWQMETNFMGMTRVCSAVLPYMRSQRSGRIINISSIAGVVAVPYQGFYSASKFAIEGYSEALAVEVRRFGIRVCLVEPGDFRTGFTSSRKMSEATLADPDYSESFRRTMAGVEKDETRGSCAASSPADVRDSVPSPAVSCRPPSPAPPAFSPAVSPSSSSHGSTQYDVWNDDRSEATFSPYWEGVRGMGRQGALPWEHKKASEMLQRLFPCSLRGSNPGPQH